MNLTVLLGFLSLLSLTRSAVTTYLSSPDPCSAISEYKNILVVAAHPDDIETIAGGTVSLFVSCGKTVNYVITTNGDKGWGKDTSMTSAELAGIREQEQLNAAAVSRVNNVTFLRQEDGRLDGVDPILLKRNITKWVRLNQPDLVLTFNPETDYSTYKFGLMHEDHKLTGLSTMNTLWPSARDYLNYYELYEQGILPWICPEAWLFSFSTPTNAQSEIVVVNITGQHFENKYLALLQHKSQYTDASAVRQSLVNIGAYVAQSNLDNPDKNTLAEAFVRVRFL